MTPQPLRTRSEITFETRAGSDAQGSPAQTLSFPLLAEHITNVQVKIYQMTIALYGHLLYTGTRRLPWARLDH